MGGKVEFSKIYDGVIRGLLGKSLKSVLPETLLLNEKMLSDLNFEYYTPKTKTPFSSIAFFKEENEFYHPWSINQVGEHYGYHKLKELIEPRDYLTLPSVIVDEFLEACSLGLGKREKFEADRAKERARQSGLPKEQQDELRKAGIDPNKVKA